MTQESLTPNQLPNVRAQTPEETQDFPKLLRRFEASDCGAEAFSLATWMFARFPNESKQLLPLIRDEQLACDGRADNAATRHEWAAALVAAKTIRRDNGTAFAEVTEAQAHDNIVRIYNENHRGGAGCSLL